MRITKLITFASLSVALSATANAQFSVSGAGSAIPGTGDGGDVAADNDALATYDTVQAGLQATSTVAVPVAVTSIDSIQIQGLAHTWVGDTQATLEDPAGVEHLIWLRPGFLNTGNFGSSGDFDGGDYTIVGDGSGSSMQTTSGAVDLPAGTYNQSFGSGGTTWVSGTNGINNTAMGSIAGAAGTWTLNIYDWAGGDSGSFTGWTLNGNGGGGANTGTGFCFGDGSGIACPCGNIGASGAGCTNSGGTGASLTASGNAGTGAADTLSFTVSGVNGIKPGLLLRGDNQIAAMVGGGILCVGSNTQRSQVQATDASGSTTFTDWNGAGFESVANAGVPTNFQFWYRDPGGVPCAGTDFNFTNGHTVTYP